MSYLDSKGIPNDIWYVVSKFLPLRVYYQLIDHCPPLKSIATIKDVYEDAVGESLTDYYDHPAVEDYYRQLSYIRTQHKSHQENMDQQLLTMYCQCGYLSLVKEIINKKREKPFSNEYIRKLFHEATKHSQIKVIKYLSSIYVVQLKDYFDLALEQKDEKLVKYFIENGGCSHLDVVSLVIRNDLSEMVPYLIEKGLYNHESLFTAINWDDFASVKLLVDAGTDLQSFPFLRDGVWYDRVFIYMITQAYDRYCNILEKNIGTLARYRCYQTVEELLKRNNHIQWCKELVLAVVKSKNIALYTLLVKANPNINYLEY